MENSLKGLMLSAGIIITCVIISLGFYISREASNAAEAGAGKINELQAEFYESSYTIYDGATVSGSEVVNLIRKFADEGIGIKVVTKKSESFYLHKFNTADGELLDGATLTYKSAQDVSKSNYINPTGRFEGAVVRDANDTITGLIFTQE